MTIEISSLVSEQRSFEQGTILWANMYLLTARVISVLKITGNNHRR